MKKPRFNYDAPNIRIEPFVPEFKQKFIRSPFDKEMNANPRINRAKLLEFEHDNSYIIRKSNASVAADRSKVEAECEKVRKLFLELEEVYAICSPVHFVVAEDIEGNVALYCFTKRVCIIEYESLTEAEQKLAAQAMHKLCKSLFRSFQDKLNADEEYLEDIVDIGQYEYGVVEGDSAPRWYLIDTDPYYKKKAAEDSWYDYYDNFHGFIQEVEVRFLVDLSFERLYFEKLLKEEEL